MYVYIYMYTYIHVYTRMQSVSGGGRTIFRRIFAASVYITSICPLFLLFSQASVSMDCGDLLDPFPRYKYIFFSALGCLVGKYLAC